MIIRTKLSKEDFIRVNFVLLYSRFFVKIITALSIIYFVVSLLALFFDSTNFNIGRLIGPVLFAAALPLITYLSARRNYASAPRISETIEYEFDKNNLLVKGESFSSQLSWNKIYKVSKLKNWILIWQNSQVANAIPRRDIWEGDIMKLKEILDMLQVKNNL
jgi:hypothetical protein